MSVGEFSTFNLFQSKSDRAIHSQKRLSEGKYWHDQLAEATPEAQCERTLKATFAHGSWTLKLQGRLDQYLPDCEQAHAFIAREIKTTTKPLPISEETILEHYQHYCIQAATYAAILKQETLEKRVRAELLFVTVETGKTQCIDLQKRQETLFERQLNTVVRSLEAKQNKLAQLATLPTGLPYATLREGQHATLNSLKNTSPEEAFIFLEAPTGFGKTGILLDYALERLKQGTIEHIIYTTGKTTGQPPVLEHLKKVLPKDSGLNYLQLRSHEEAAIHSPLHMCMPPFNECARQFLGRIQESGLTEKDLFSSGKLDLQSAQQLGRRYGLCPHTLLLYALKWANLWVCDYNYIFAQTQRSLLNHHGHWDPKKTLLIIDEAHNLPGRIEQNLSARISIQDSINIYDFLENANASSKTLRTWQALIDTLSSVLPADHLHPDKANALIHALESAAKSLSLEALQELPTTIGHGVDQVTHASTLARDQRNTYWMWAPKHATLQISCLSAASAISSTLARLHTTVFSSATLASLDVFREACGIPSQAGKHIIGEAPWKRAAYSIAVDSRVDTRYTKRSHFYSKTASTIALLAETSETPVAAFFPSYKYAHEIYTHLQCFAPWARISLQTQAKSANEQAQELALALEESQILLLVLGSRFSEGVDFLGSKIDTAVVVGPALPEVNPLQEARMKACSHLGRHAAFRRIYIEPGMKKINQALGRLVRTPGQKAKVLLHCQRFADPLYTSLLPPECKSASILKTEADLEDWLAN